MNNKIAKILERPMRYLAYQAFASQDDWSNYNIDKESLKWKLIDKDTVRFYRKDHEQWAWVEVSNLSPVKITNTVFHDPKILNKKTTDAYSSVASNDSDVVEMTRSYSITEGRSESQTTNVGASVTVGIHQSIGYGSEIAQVQGETSFGIDVTASFDAGWEYGNSTERTVTTDITIPPKTRTTVTATKEISKLRQTVDYTAELDFTVKLQNHGTQYFEIESMDDVRAIVDGNGYPGLLKNLNGVVGETELQRRLGGIKRDGWLKQVVEPITTTYSDTLTFDSAQTGSVILTSTPIK